MNFDTFRCPCKILSAQMLRVTLFLCFLALGSAVQYYTQVQYRGRDCSGINYATVQRPARTGECENLDTGCISCILGDCSFRESCRPLMPPSTEPSTITSYTYADSTCSGDPQQVAASSLLNSTNKREICGTDTVFEFQETTTNSGIWKHSKISVRSCSSGVSRSCIPQFECSESEDARMAMYALAAYEEQTPGEEVRFQSQRIPGSFVLNVQVGWRTVGARPEWFLSYDMCLKAPVLTVRGSGRIVSAEMRDWVANSKVFSTYQHAGFLARAQTIYSQVSGYFESEYLPSHRPNPALLYVTGHSLGAGVASLLPSVMENLVTVSGYENYISEIRGYGFATPRVFSRSYVQNNQLVTYSNRAFLPNYASFKSYVYRDDLIPRLGVTSAARASEKCGSSSIPEILWFLSLGGTLVGEVCTNYALGLLGSNRLVPLYEIPGDVYHITDSGISSSSSDALFDIQNSLTATYDHSMEHYLRGVGGSVVTPPLSTSWLLDCPIKLTCIEPDFSEYPFKRSIASGDFRSSLSYHCLLSSTLQCIDIFGQPSNLTLVNALNPESYCLSRNTIVINTKNGVFAADLDDGIPVNIRNTSISYLLCDNYDRIYGINGTQVFDITRRYTVATLPQEPTSSIHIISNLRVARFVYMVGTQLTIFDLEIGVLLGKPAVVYQQYFDNVVGLSATSIDTNTTISLLRSDSIFTFRIHTEATYITTKDNVTTPVPEAANFALDPFGGLVILFSDGAVQPIGNVFIPPAPQVPISTQSPNSQSTSDAGRIACCFMFVLLSLL